MRPVTKRVLDITVYDSSQLKQSPNHMHMGLFAGKERLKKQLLKARHPDLNSNIIRSMAAPDKFFTIVMHEPCIEIALPQLNEIWRKAESSTRYRIRSLLANHRDELINNEVYNAWILDKNKSIEN